VSGRHRNTNEEFLMFRVRRRAVLGLVAAALSLSLATACGSSDSAGGSEATGNSADAIYSGSGKVAFIAPAATITIWADAWIPQYVNALKKYAPNVEPLIYYANFDVSKQFAQVQAAIAQGAKVIVIAAVDPNQTDALAKYAEAHDVKIIATERQFLNQEIAGYTAESSFEVGATAAKWIKENTKKGDTIATLWGDATDVWYSAGEVKGFNSVLGPLFESGERKQAGNVYTKGYLPDNAHREMSAILSQTNNDVDAVFAANDDMAGGVIAALDSVGLDGKVKVVGTDATISGLQHVLRGTQAMSVFHGIKSADVNAQASAYILAGKEFPKGLFNDTVSNGEKGGKEITIPFATQPPSAITKDNIQEVVDVGFLPKATICKGLPDGTAPDFCG
jgi:D-xylose transport system substrate-binding protein